MACEKSWNALKNCKIRQVTWKNIIICLKIREFLHNIEVRIQEVKGKLMKRKQQQESEQIIAAFTEEDRLVCSQAAEIERISGGMPK